MNILTAPIFAVLRPLFYRQVIASPLSRGFLYLAYLSFLATCLVFFNFQMRAVPQMDAFADWVVREMPQMTWTPEGLVMNRQSPYVMIHPEYGPLAEFDTTKTDAAVADMGEEVYAYITSTKMLVRSGSNEVRIYDLTERPAGTAPDQLIVQIDGASVETFYRSLKPWISVLIFGLFFPFFYLLKLLEALFYSVIATLINLKRLPPLEYPAVLNLCLFGLTAATVLQLRSFILPSLGVIPFGILGSLLVTSIYLFIGVRKTQDLPEKPEAENA